MPIKLDSYYIYSLSTFKTLGQYNGEDENALHNTASKGEGNAKRKLAKSIEDTSFQRTIQPAALDYYKNKDVLVGIFENELVRYIKAHYPDQIVRIAGGKKLVKGLAFMEVGKTHSGILKSIIDNGVIIENKEYHLYTAGSGQMRQNEITLVEKPILDGFKNLYACGLTDEIINTNGGMNTGKYLAYSALPLSSSKPIDIDINKIIVVHDLELSIKKEVEYIDIATFERTFITHEAKGEKLNQTDGAGMVLPSTLREIENQLNVGYSISGFQIRGPWIKGALFPFDFKAFALACRNSIVTDIYGVKHDVITEDIQMILTESQFKAHSYYKHIGGWDEYKRHFIANGLSFSVTQVSNRPKPESAVNYQFLQTLDRDKAASVISTSDRGDETIQIAPEIEALCRKSTDHLKKLRCDQGEVLKAFGAVEDNPNKKPLQEALILYPRLLLDKGVKNEISRARQSAKRDFLKGKLLVAGFYGYAMPDMYGFCQYLFTGNTNPQGIIGPDEVYCDYYRNAKSTEVDLLRAPHLGNEHSIRQLNHSPLCKDWFRHCGTNVIYSLQDYLMLACMGDVDGDSLFITPEPALIDLVRPHSVLFYEMAKAPKKEVNDDSRFETLVNSFKCNDHVQGCTIGSISNTLTKIWNADTITPELADLIKYLVMLNNYTIDYPKTQKALDLPVPIQEQYEKIRKALPPHFFKWAKGKKKVDKLNNSIMSQVVACVSSVKETRLIYFNKKETFDYSMLQRRTTEGEIYGVDRYSPVYKEIHTKLYSLGEEAQQLKRIIEAKQKKAWESGRKEIDFELFYGLQNAIALELLLNLCGWDVVMLANILVDIHYNQEPITNLHNVIWKCTGDIIVENLRLNLGMSDYKPMIRQRKAYNKLSALVREAEIEREQRKPVIYEHDISQLQEIEDSDLRKLYFALLVEAKRNPSHIVTLTRNPKGLTFQKLVAKAGFERWTKPRKEGGEKKLVPCMPRKQAIQALEARRLIELQRDKARSGDAYALPRASFEQAGNSVVTIEPRTRPRIYYENLFNGVELAKCEMCDRPFTKNGNAQKFCGPDCAKAKKRADDNDRYRARKNSQIEKSLEA